MGKLGGTATTEIDAPLLEVWAVIEDVLSSPEWQGGLISMEALETDAHGRATLVETVNDAKVRHVKTRVRFSYDEPHRLAWSQEKGDLKSLDGSWHLEDLGGRTRVTYTLEGDPGRMLGMLVRGPVEDSIRKHLVEARPAELEARVGGR
jgi:carbon monoxide dehydrogenase subunit G